MARGGATLTKVKLQVQREVAPERLRCTKALPSRVYVTHNRRRVFAQLNVQVVYRTEYRCISRKPS